MSAYEPQDPHYQLRVSDSFRRQRAMQSLGIRLDRVGPGTKLGGVGSGVAVWPEASLSFLRACS